MSYHATFKVIYFIITILINRGFDLSCLVLINVPPFASLLVFMQVVLPITRHRFPHISEKRQFEKLVFVGAKMFAEVW